MAQTSQAVAPAQSAVAAAIPLLSNSELETIEQLGRDYWVITETKEAADRKLAQCDVALFDLVDGRDYPAFMAVRGAYITGCRDKGAASDEAAAKPWEAAIKRITASCGFVRPKAQTRTAKAMSEKRAAALAELAAKSESDLQTELDSAVAQGTAGALKKATALRAELDKRNKPALDAADAVRKALLDKIIARAKELAKAKTDDADALLDAAFDAMSADS
jgi:hypothetical protein